MLKRDQIQTFKHYSAYNKNSINGHGGVCILVKNNFIHSQVQFQADLQAVAVCITINNKAYTVASVYVSPSETLNELAFDRIIKSISSRYLILGDFNDHSYLWGANQENERGKAVEHLIDSHNLILFNDSVHTRLDTYHQTSSLLDLSLCHPSIYMDVACEFLSDKLRSYHHLIIIHILLDIINETWKSDTFPESWREALIISIPKPGKDHFIPLNYRPIAFTSCIYKTVERTVNERLVWYLEKTGLLAKQQCGYRANRSTVDHLISLETFIRDAFIQNPHLVAVFFD